MCYGTCWNTFFCYGYNPFAYSCADVPRAFAAVRAKVYTLFRRRMNSSPYFSRSSGPVCPSHFPQSISMIAGSVSTFSPKIEAVLCALERGLANHLNSKNSAGTLHVSTLFIPFGLKGISACPCNLFCSFQAVGPCRIKAMCVIPTSLCALACHRAES